MGSLRWLALAGLMACSGTDSDDNAQDTDTGAPPETTGDTGVEFIDTNEKKVDTDGDGVLASPGGDDCNDLDPLVFPGAPELCGDKIDQDCDGNIIAENVATWYPDGLLGRALPFDIATELAKGDFEVEGGEVVVCGGNTDLGANTLRLFDDVLVYSSVPDDSVEARLTGTIEIGFRADVIMRDVTLSGDRDFVVFSEDGRALSMERVSFDAGSNVSAVFVEDLERVEWTGGGATGNVATGALFDLNARSVSLSGIELSGNTSGSGLVASGETVILIDPVVTGDNAGITVESPSLSVSGGTLSKLKGGDAALLIENSNGTVSALTVDGNPGTGILVRRDVRAPGAASPAITMSGVTVTASGTRGIDIVATEPQDVTIDNSSIRNNGGKTVNGGGLRVDGDGEQVVSALQTVISGNTGANGGGVYLRNAQFSLSFGTVQTNGAKQGGGIFVDKGAAFEFKLTDFGLKKTDNTPEDIFAGGKSFGFEGTGSGTCDDVGCK